MDNLDISVLVERIGDHRFDGYTDNMLADEIDRFRSGPGISGISDAVAALKAVAESLSETDDTLRRELGKLGVEWSSDAGRQAGETVTRQADFSAEANDKVNDSAERIFAQGEAFNRTLHKLPDAQSLRQGAGGYGLFDSVASLLGFETDNTRRVAEAREARQQALQALNSYAQNSGENLAGTQELGSPRAVVADTGPRLPGAIDAGGGPGDVTIAAGAANTPVPPPVPAPGPAVAPATGAAANVPTPALGLPVQQPARRSTGSVGAAPGTAPHQATAPSSAPTAPTPVTSVAGVSRQVPQYQQPGTVSGSGSASVTPSTGVPAVPTGSGAAPGTVSPSPPPATGGVVTGPRAPGAAVPGPIGGTPGAPGGAAVPGSSGGAGGASGAPPAAGAVVGKSATPGAGGGVGGAAEQQPLAKGKSFGAVPQPSVPGGTVSSGGFTAVPRGASVNDLGAGAAALAAGGVAGALSGDDARRGRGVGRSAPGAARSPHQLAIGDLPEEEAKAQRNSERLSPRAERQRGGFLEKAAPQQGGEDDATHVRRYGVDDTDLFTDQRMVAPDVLGDDADGRR
ncbi:magnesium chelatase [Saccharomonospora sp. NPDC046836]|uniref:magnesium chelatase n=1 Tax=Saccharomonospora sp. NPDC046836 TaxID=3156921 RepID=UPI0033DC7956